MSATTASATVRPWRPPARRHDSPVVLVARTTVRSLLPFVGWFWGIVLIAGTVGAVIVLQFAEPELSIVAFARQGVVWFTFSLAIAVATTSFPAYVAAGITRRAFVTGAVVGQLVLALAHTAAMGAALWLEQVGRAALGWESRIIDLALAPDGTDIGAALVEFSAHFVVAVMSGLLVGSIYLRGRGWWGTLTLPLTVGPVILAGGVGGLGVVQLLAAAPTRALVHVGAGLLLAAALAVTYAIVARGTELRTSS